MENLPYHCARRRHGSSASAGTWSVRSQLRRSAPSAGSRNSRCSPSRISVADGEDFYPSPHPVLKSRCGGSRDPDRQLFVPTRLEGVQAFSFRKTGFLCPSCATKEKKNSLIPRAVQGPRFHASGQGYQHLHSFIGWSILRSFLFCFSLKPKNIREQISPNVTALRFKIQKRRINWTWASNCPTPAIHQEAFEITT